jgi:hypothetical protein
MALLAGLGPTATSATADPASPVVLELFTSQGCSSCPPADEILSRLGRDEKAGTRVIPLAFHVDYWNRIGWRDPFSSAEWTLRQEAYGRRFDAAGMYTPQLIVNGRAQTNGAQARGVLAEVASQLARPAPPATIHLVLSEPARAALSIEVAAEVTGSVAGDKLNAVVAVFENDLVTKVERGENRGLTLRNDYVVRRLQTAFALEPKAGASGRRTLELKLGRDWKPENLGVAAFLQDKGSLQIHAAAVRTLRSGALE